MVLNDEVSMSKTKQHKPRNLIAKDLWEEPRFKGRKFKESKRHHERSNEKFFIDEDPLEDDRRHSHDTDNSSLA